MLSLYVIYLICVTLYSSEEILNLLTGIQLVLLAKRYLNSPKSISYKKNVKTCDEPRALAWCSVAAVDWLRRACARVRLGRLAVECRMQLLRWLCRLTTLHHVVRGASELAIWPHGPSLVHVPLPLVLLSPDRSKFKWYFKWAKQFKVLVIY